LLAGGVREESDISSVDVPVVIAAKFVRVNCSFSSANSCHRWRLLLQIEKNLLNKYFYFMLFYTWLHQALALFLVKQLLLMNSMVDKYFE